MKKLSLKLLKTLCVAAIIALTLLPCACSAEKNEVCDKYEITAEYDGDRTITAIENVFFVNRGEGMANRIYFHLYPRAYEKDAQFKANENIRSFGKITIDGVTSDKASESEIEGEDKDLLCVVPCSPVFPGENMTITVRFTLILPECDDRYGINSSANINLFGFYPVLCYGDTSPYYPYGEPFVSDVADYTVNFTTPEGTDVIAGGFISEKTVGHGKKITTIRANNTRFFAMSLGSFVQRTAKAGKTTVSSCFSTAEKAESALKTVVSAVATFSRLFGEYPYEYLSVAGSPGAGICNASGIYTVGEEQNESLFTDSVIFGAARQWWGGVVGFDAVNCAFMQEGLSEYSASVFYEKNANYSVSFDERMRDATLSYSLFVTELKPESTVMQRKICDFNNKTEYLFCSRLKGELLLHSIRKTVGDKAFFESLKRFYGDNSGKVASPDCLFASIEKTCGKNMKSYSDSWINGNDVVGKT